MIDRRTILVSGVGLAGAGAWFQWASAAKQDVAKSRVNVVQGPPRPPRSSLPAGADIFMNVEIRGGGFVSAGTRSRSGNWEMCGTDTATSFIRRPGEDWRSVLLAHTIPDMKGRYDHKLDVSDGAGSYTQAIADNGVAYTCLRGYLLRSDDAFQSRARVIMGPKRMFENRGAQRTWNSKMAIDRDNADIFVIGCMGTGELGGAYYSLDGGRTAPVRIAGLPDPVEQAGQSPILVATDPNNSTMWALSIYGHGIFISTNGAAGPYAPSPGSSKLCRDLQYDNFGRIIVVNYDPAQVGSKEQVKVFENGAWRSEVMRGIADIASACVNPKNKDHMFAMNPNGGVVRTIKGADGQWKWADFEHNDWPTPQKYHCPRRPWQDTSDSFHKGIYTSCARFDPVIANRVNLYHGTGTCYIDVPAKFGGVEFHDTTVGIEQIVCNGGLSYEGGDHWLYGWDKGAWKMNDFSIPAAIHYPETVEFTHCWHMDVSPSKRTVVMLNNASNGGGHKSAYSVDKAPFVVMKNQLPTFRPGGCIGAFDDKTFLWVPFNNGQAYYTEDRGETRWKLLDLGVPMPADGQESGWSFAMYFKKECVVASNETPGRGWLVNYGPSGFEHLRGIWQTDTGPKGPWRRVHDGPPGGHHWMLFHHMVMKEVPGHADFLLMSGGGAPDHDEPLMASRDGGKKWKPLVSGPRGVSDFSFGKPEAGAKYPVLRLIARVGEVQNGVFEIDDLDDPKLKLITESPAGMVTDNNRAISGDMNFHGKWAYGYGGSGWRGSMKQV